MHVALGKWALCQYAGLTCERLNNIEVFFNGFYPYP